MENDLKEIYKLLKNTKIIGSGNRTNLNYGGSRAYTMPCGLKWDYINSKYDTTAFDRDNPTIYPILQKFMNKYYPNIKYNSFQINRNFQTLPHKDKNNNGNSLIVGLGDYINGELMLYENDKIKKIDIKYKPYIFDGSKILHWTNNYKGDRYSFVSYYI
tara:strand:- start:95 stop:571 length:477 start_codon:yes stop_codon:yes gene_type:complete